MLEYPHFYVFHHLENNIALKVLVMIFAPLKKYKSFYKNQFSLFNVERSNRKVSSSIFSIEKSVLPYFSKSSTVILAPKGTPILFRMYLPNSLLSFVVCKAFLPSWATTQSKDCLSSVIKENVYANSGKKPSFLESPFKLKYAWLGSRLSQLITPVLGCVLFESLCPQFKPDNSGRIPFLSKKLMVTLISGISHSISPGGTLATLGIR